MTSFSKVSDLIFFCLGVGYMEQALDSVEKDLTVASKV